MSGIAPARAGGSEVRVLRHAAEAVSLLDPDRIRLVEELRRQPDSAAGLARRLGEKRQRLNYHLRLLEDAGVLEPLPADHVRPGREKVLRVTARQFVVDPGALGPLGAGSDVGGDRRSASHLVGLAARTIREVADLQERATASGRRLATGSLDAELSLDSPERFRAFLADLSEAVAGVVARHHRPGEGSRAFRVMAGVHQAAEQTAHRRTPTEEEAT